MRANFDPSVTWKDLEWVRANWDGPLILKGILDPEDARVGRRCGRGRADRGLQPLAGGSWMARLSTTRALPPIADAVGDRLTVLADGGVRSGLDVVRMLALGAQGVMLGRAWAYALAGGMAELAWPICCA